MTDYRKFIDDFYLPFIKKLKKTVKILKNTLMEQRQSYTKEKYLNMFNKHR